MAIEDERRDWFEMSRVIDRGVQTFRRTWGIGVLAALLLVALPEMASFWLEEPIDADGAFTQTLIDTFARSSTAFAVVTLVLGTICQTVVVFTALEHFRGQRPTLGNGLTAGFRLILPALGLTILVSIAILLGLVLLVVPGLFVMTTWSVALPARLHRGPGVTEAIQESYDLTKGVRWRVFGLLLITAFVLGAVAFGLDRILSLLPASAEFMDGGVLAPLLSGFSNLFLGYGAASLFHELKWGGRHSEEDVTAELFA